MKYQRNDDRRGGKGPVALRAAVFFVLAPLFFSLPSCGFHLRGYEALSFPPELQTLRLTMRNAGANPPLLIEVRNALQAYGTVRITDDVSASVPVLNIENEFAAKEVLAYDSLGRVSAFNLNYRVIFTLRGADGKPLLNRQSVRLQREYSFDRLRVLASEKQSDFVQNEMRRDAAHQILRRLARVRVPGASSDSPVDANQP